MVKVNLIPALGLVLLPALQGCFLMGLSAEEETKLSVHLANARRYYEGGSLLQARQQALLGLEVDSSNEDLLILLGWIHLKQDTREDIWAAEDYFSQVDGGSLFGGENWEAALGHGLALRRQGDLLAVGAERAARKPAEDLRDPDLPKKMRAESKTKYEQATARLERVLELNPKNPRALDSLQQIYALTGDFAASLARGTEFRELAVKSRGFWEEQLKRTDISAEIEENFRAKISSNRRREAASRGLSANLLFKMQRYTEALGELNTLLDLDPEISEEYFHRALCRAALRDHQGAIDDLEIFLRKTDLEFGSPKVQEAYGLIRKYKKGAGPTGNGS